MAVSSIQQRPGRADFDAVTALRTIQPAPEGSNHCIRAAIAGFDCFFTHPFIADTRAALAEDAALGIVRDDRRKILLRLRVFVFYETLFEIAPVEGQLLKFAFTTSIAYRAIEWMIHQQKLEHRTLRLFNLFALRGHDHAVGADDRAGGLQLGHLLDAHQAHATGSLQSEVGVIAE